MTDDEGKQNRQSPRFDVDWRVKLKCADWNAAQRVAAANVSRGGLFIATGKPPTVGARVELAIDLPDGSNLLLRGTCVHVRSPEQALQLQKSPGFGLKVDDSQMGDLLLLEEMARVSAMTPAELERSLPSLQPAAAAPPAAAPPAAAPPAAAPPAAAPPAAAPPPADQEEPVTLARIRRPAKPDVEEVRGPGVADSTERPAPDRTPLRQPAPAASAPPLAITPMPPSPTPRPAAPAAGPPRRPTAAPLRSPAPAVGIDFGTTFTRVSIHTADGVRLIEDDEGRAMMPSIISYPDEGGCVVGWDARELLVNQPQRTIASAKRLLGRRADHHEIQGLLASSAFRTETGPGGQLIFQIGGQPLAVPQVCAAIIRQAVQGAERRLGARVRKAVFSMPVTFEAEQQAALKRAAMLAGVEVVALIEEPVAGALQYGFGRGANEMVAVYDFGGGTFDFTLLDVSRDVFRVLASRGDAWLGGDDFDLALAQWAADQFWRQTKVELRQRVVEWQRLLLAAEAAKVRLTEVAATTIAVPQIYRRFDLNIPVDRGVAEGLWRELVDRSLQVCQEALQAAGLDARDVGQVVLTGGTTYVPQVRSAVSAFFERELTAVVSPDVAVVEGAGIHAARVTGAVAG
jgi:molecular chaperone DnaK